LRELIFIVVETFYQKAIKDILLGYHFTKFNDPIILSSHLERITSFWEMQLTGKPGKPIEGKPFQLLFTHLQLNIKRGELGRWIILFHQTLDELEQEFREQSPADLEDFQKISQEWKKRIAFFEERFKSHKEMFRS
jgi:truncated hemoglobin YjbI